MVKSTLAASVMFAFPQSFFLDGESDLCTYHFIVLPDNFFMINT